MKTDSRAPSSKVVAGTLGGGLGVALVWAWNGLMPEYEMNAAVGAALAVALGQISAYLKQELRLWREALAVKE